MDLVEKLIAGNEKACARCLSLVENQREGYVDLLKSIYPHDKGAYRVGFTGQEDLAKSQLLVDLIEEYLEEGKKVGLLLMGPSSPQTGGAFLGGRERFAQLSGKEGVFIRSVASRGHQGGISYAVPGMMRILDAYGCDLILLESLGGPLDTDLSQVVDCLVNVISPYLSQDMELLNAGSLELTQIFFVNQGRGRQEEKTKLDIEMMLDLQEDREERPLVLSFQDRGVSGLKEVIDDFKDYLLDMGHWKQDRLKQEVMEVESRMRGFLKDDLEAVIRFEEEAIARALEEGSNPYLLAEELLDRYFK